MASRWAIGATFLVFMLAAACKAPVPTTVTEKRSGGGSSRAGKTAASPAAPVVPVSLTVSILGAAPDVVTRFGTSAAVPTGGTPVQASPAAYSLAQAGRFVPVPQADVSVTDLAGRALAGRGLRTDATGAVKLPKIVTGAPLIFLRASYVVSGRRVVLSAIVPTPKGDGTTTVDPVTTLVAKRLETLGRFRAVDLAVFPPEVPAKFAQALAEKLSDQEIAAIGLLDPEPAARLLDARLEADTGVRDAITAAGGQGGATVAFMQALPRLAPPSPSGGPNAQRSLRPDESDARPTTLPSLDVSLAPLTPEPSVSPSPVAVSAPPSKAPSVAPSVAPSPSPSPSVSPALSPSPEASVSPSPSASVEPSVSPSAST